MFDDFDCTSLKKIISRVPLISRLYLQRYLYTFIGTYNKTVNISFQLHPVMISPMAGLCATNQQQ